MDIHNKSHNFDGLLAAWLDKLDTEELNRPVLRRAIRLVQEGQ